MKPKLTVPEIIKKVLTSPTNPQEDVKRIINDLNKEKYVIISLLSMDKQQWESDQAKRVIKQITDLIDVNPFNNPPKPIQDFSTPLINNDTNDIYE